MNHPDFFERFPQEILKQFFSYLNIIELNKICLVCKEWNLLMNEKTSSFIYRDQVTRNIGIIYDNKSDQINLRVLNSFENWKKINYLLFKNGLLTNQTPPKKNKDGNNPRRNRNEQLIFTSVRASSTDEENQSIENTLHNPRLKNSSFWSSKGTKTSNTNDYLTYKLVSPFSGNREAELGCILIKKLRINFFIAGWQNCKCYKSEKVSFSISNEDQDAPKKKEIKEKERNDRSFGNFRSIEFTIDNSTDEEELKKKIEEEEEVEDNDEIRGKIHSRYSFDIPLLLIEKNKKRIKPSNDSPKEEKKESKENLEKEEEEQEKDEEKIEKKEEKKSEEEEDQEDYENEELRYIEQSLSLLLRSGRLDNLSEDEMGGIFGYLRHRFQQQKHAEFFKEIEKRKEDVENTGNWFFKLNLINKTTTQPGDNKYYVVLDRVEVLGDFIAI